MALNLIRSEMVGYDDAGGEVWEPTQKLEREALQKILDANPDLKERVTRVITGNEHSVHNGIILKAPIPIEWIQKK